MERWRPERRERELCYRRRERYVLGGERKVNKIIKRNYSISVRTLSYLKAYCSISQNFETFSTSHEGLFLVFSVPNAKYLAFGTPDENLAFGTPDENALIKKEKKKLILMG